MTVRRVLDRGFTPRRERGDPAKLAWFNQDSARRFADLQWLLEARRLNIKTANRRFRRRRGLTFQNT